MSRSMTTKKGLSSLSPRQRQVLGCIGLGMSDAEIAAVLGISQSTVSSHLGHLYRRLGIHSRIEAAVKLYREEALSANATRRGSYPTLTVTDRR